MTTRVGILPLDILHTLSASLEQKDAENAEYKPTNGLPFLRLPHPRTGLPCLFLPSESSADASMIDTTSNRTTILEVQAVTPPDARSWFIEQEVVADGGLLLMTPIDPAFLLIPILQAVNPRDGTSGIFRPADDIFEEASLKLQMSLQPNARSDGEDNVLANLATDILRFTALDCVRDALRRVCDFKEITPDIVVYRFSLQKTTEYLRSKVARLATPEVQELSRTIVRGLAKDGLMEDNKESLLEVGRIRAACDLLAQYLPPDIRASLVASYDFAKLDEYIETIKNEIATQTAASANPARVKAVNIAPSDDKKRKNKTSHGVEKLKKVNISGMAKLSSFFKKT